MKRTILYVDDEDVNLFLFQHTMDAHFNIITAESGADGLEILASNDEIVAVVSDMSMPEMNGVEFITTAKSKLPDLYYVILTGYSFNQEIKDAVESGLVSGFFTKPYDVDELQVAINKLVKEAS
ncbi:MAG: response regulator [Cytophagales bacterium]|nr:response regulator [Cytophagales bacterium]